jgi:hypothetical protein
VRGVGASQGDRALVLVQVVAALRQAEAGLAQVREVDLGILEVRLDPDPEQRAEPGAV